MTMKAVKLTIVASLLVISCQAWISASHKNQYEKESHPLFSSKHEITATESNQDFNLNARKPDDKNGVSFNEDKVVAHLHHLQKLQTNTGKLQKVFLKTERQKRDVIHNQQKRYLSYRVRIPTSNSIQKPRSYVLDGPYFISTYISPKSYSTNKSYLSPSPKAPDSLQDFDLEDRFGAVWDSSPAKTTPTQNKGYGEVNTSTFPPLIHNADPNTDKRKPIIHTTTTDRTSRVEPISSEEIAAYDRNGLSSTETNQCAFAIINCCTHGSKDASLKCFERMGCPGPFWDSSPCEKAFTKQAISDALNYYQAK